MLPQTAGAGDSGCACMSPAWRGLTLRGCCRRQRTRRHELPRQLLPQGLHRGDAADVLDRLPDASLSRVYLFYPDPWPKRRHRKRRFVSTENLDRLAREEQHGLTRAIITGMADAYRKAHAVTGEK